MVITTIIERAIFIRNINTTRMILRLIAAVPSVLATVPKTMIIQKKKSAIPDCG